MTEHISFIVNNSRHLSNEATRELARLIAIKTQKPEIFVYGKGFAAVDLTKISPEIIEVIYTFITSKIKKNP